MTVGLALIRIQIAIGLCISLPDLSPFNTNGISANADVKAVINIGGRRSLEPSIMEDLNVPP